MAAADDSNRRFPLVAVTRDQLAALLASLLKGKSIRSIQPVEGGLTNTILRVSTGHPEPDLLIRIYPGGRPPWEKEQRLLMRLGVRLPVPTVLLADEGQGTLPYPSMVYQWIEGMTLNAMRRQTSIGDLLSLAEPLGQVVADIAGFEPGDEGFQVEHPLPSSPETLLSLCQHLLLSTRTRARLGESLADALWLHFSSEAGRLQSLGSARCLVHGDLGGRNILVTPNGPAGWRITGIVDWEDAFIGWATWDVGTVFRYRRRYGQAFRDRFERGYRGCGGTLPKDWWRTARLLDAIRQLATLDSERVRPAAFADCRELLEDILHDDS